MSAPAGPAFELTALAALVDDAAVFPPGNAPLRDAVRAHLARHDTPAGVLVGPLVLTPAHLAGELPLDPDRADGSGPLAVALVLRDPDAVDAAVQAVLADSRLRLAAVELVAEPATAARCRELLPPQVALWVEPGWGPHLSAAVAALAGTGCGLKLRTGGTTADAFPAAGPLAEALAVAVRHDVRVKATAGLHHAVRHRDPGTGFEHHGFVNLLLAAAAADQGATAALQHLTRTDPDGLAADLAALGVTGLAAARQRFASFGSCDVDTPRRDLEALGLLARSTPRTAGTAVTR